MAGERVGPSDRREGQMAGVLGYGPEEENRSWGILRVPSMVVWRSWEVSGPFCACFSGSPGGSQFLVNSAQGPVSAAVRLIEGDSEHGRWAHATKCGAPVGK